MLVPLADHHLLVFWVQLVVLLVLARGLGHLARRVGQPSVVGELAAGILVGPSVLGLLWPAGSGWLLPADALQSGLLLAVAWLGAVLLLAVTGAEIDLGFVRRTLRSSSLIGLGAFAVPLIAGMAVAGVLPDVFVGPLGDRAALVGFVGAALAISSLPVIAQVLRDMGLLQRTVGQLAMVATTVCGLLAWTLLGALAAVADGGLSGWDLAASLGAIALFVVTALTVGQRGVDLALRASLRLTDGTPGAISASVVVILAFAALGQWLGTEAVFGAFVAGILLGRSPFRRREARLHLELLVGAVFAPLFFATVGLMLDIGALLDLEVAGWTLVLVVVASAARVLGAQGGGRLGGVDGPNSLAVAVGLNARGALGVVAASVGLSVGVISEEAHTALVLVAVVTSMTMPWLLRRSVAALPATTDDQRRLQDAALFSESVTFGATRVLLSTSGGPDSRVAARLLDLAMPDHVVATVLAVHDGEDAATRETVAGVAELFGRRRVEHRVRRATDPVSVILREVGAGHDLVALGASAEVDHPSRLSPVLRRLLGGSPVPVLLVRAGEDTGRGLTFQRILTTSTGTRTSRAAEEVAFQLGVRTGADVDVVHVVSRADQVFASAWSGQDPTHPTAQTLLARSLDLGRRLGLAPSAVTRVGTAAYEELLQAAEDRRTDTIVVGTRIRDLDGDLFLGHGVEYLLQHAPQTLVVVAFPGDRRGGRRTERDRSVAGG